MKRMILTLLLLSLIGLSSCAGVKTVYLNDSDKVYAGQANQTITTPFDYVLMSKGKFREVTTISLEPGAYNCTKQ